jgi:hypothetical protein
MAVTINGTTGIAGVDGSAGTPAVQGADANTGMFFPAADTIAFAEGGTEVGRFDSSSNFKFNSGYGSVATAYGCRAWVNFNGTGTVAIRASGNVSSITDSGTGAYTVNFTTALADANYAGVIMTGTYQALASNDAAAPTTTAFAFISRQSSSPATSLDSAYLHVAIFR